MKKSVFKNLIKMIAKKIMYVNFTIIVEGCEIKTWTFLDNL